MNVVIRVDASTTIGHGHVKRTIAFASALRERGATVAFVSVEHAGHLCDVIEEVGFLVFRLPAQAAGALPTNLSEGNGLGSSWKDDANLTRAALAQWSVRPNWLVVDHYGIDHRWETELRESVGRIMVIDDLADRPHDCDLLLDQNLVADSLARYADKVPEGCALLLGPQYALLESVYMQMHDRVSPRAGPIRRILIAFGGADSGGFASRTVSAILTMDRADIDVDVAISAKSRQDPLIQTVSMDHPNIHVHVGLPSLAPLLANADLAIGAGGTTTWERLCLGVPSVVMTVAPNQYPAALELNRRGLICWLGGIDQVSSSTLVAALENLIEKGLDGSWSRRCLELVDGRGANRVSAALMVSGGAALRPRRATADDEDLLLAWANDPETRRNGFSSEAIPARTHHAWFRERLLDADACRLYIIETVDRLPVGMVRFERQARAWEVHYSISRIFRRQGLGRKVLETALADLVANMPDASVFGQVKNTNRASRKIFESLGFNVVSSEGEGVVVYERRLSVLTSSEREGKQ